MAEHPELWKASAPERPLFGHEHSFGVSREARGAGSDGSPAGVCFSTAPRERVYKESAAVRILCGRRGHGDSRLRGLWHRMRCRRGHHEVHGGHALQLGSQLVFVERRCRWCDTTNV